VYSGVNNKTHPIDPSNCLLTQTPPQRRIYQNKFCAKPLHQKVYPFVCCRTEQDKIIEEGFKEWVPKFCPEHFWGWKDYFCMGCNKEEPWTADHKRKTVYVCRTFAERLFFKAKYYADKLKALRETEDPNEGMRRMPNGTFYGGKKEEVNTTEFLMGRKSFMNGDRNDFGDKDVMKGAVTKFDNCEYMIHGKTFERDIEGNLMTGEDETVISWIKESNLQKNLYAALDSPEMRPPFYRNYVMRIDNDFKRYPYTEHMYDKKIYRD